MSADAQSAKGSESKESFAEMLEESLGSQGKIVGTVVNGTIIAIENDFALIDVGLKSEGRVALREFAMEGDDPELKVGDTVEVFQTRRGGPDRQDRH